MKEEEEKEEEEEARPGMVMMNLPGIILCFLSAHCCSPAVKEIRGNEWGLLGKTEEAAPFLHYSGLRRGIKSCFIVVRCASGASGLVCG